METPPLVARALALAEAHGFEKSCRPEDGALLHVLAARRGIARAAEIGTGAGVGAAWIVSALPPQTPFFTAEPDPDLAARAARRSSPTIRTSRSSPGPGASRCRPRRRSTCSSSTPRREGRRRRGVGLLAPGGTAVLDDFWLDPALPDPRRDAWLAAPAADDDRALGDAASGARSSPSGGSRFSSRHPLPIDLRGHLAPLRRRHRRLPHHVAADHLLRHHHLAAPAHDVARAEGQAGDGRPRHDRSCRLGRRRRRGRGEGGAEGGRRVPARPQEVRTARRSRPEGRSALRAAGNREDAAREGRRERVGRELLLVERLGLRRDVRRPRCRPDPQALRGGAQERAGDHLHRRARRRRHGSLGRRPQPRARPDAEPAPRRDGRLRRCRRGRDHGRLQPAPGSRPGPAAARALRPPGQRRPARPARARGDPARAHALEAARRGRRHLRARPPHGRPDRRRPREHRERGGDLRGPPRPAVHPAGGLRGRHGARADRPPEAACRDREGEAHPRLPRGRPCARRLPDGRRDARAEGDDRRAWRRARARLLPSRRGPLPPHEGGADRRDEGGARRTGRRGDRLRPGHERRRQRSREGDPDRPLDGLRVRHVRRRSVADDARGQLRALRGDEADARQRAGPAHRSRLRGGAPPARQAPRLARPARRRAAREGDDRPGRVPRDDGRPPARVALGRDRRHRSRARPRSCCSASTVHLPSIRPCRRDACALGK